VNDRNVQTFERTISPDARVLVARADLGRWRFFVSSDRLTLLEVEQVGTLGTMPTKQQYIAPNSAIEIQGRGSVLLYAQNLDSTEDAKVITWDAEYLCGGLEYVEYAEKASTTEPSAGWGDMGSFGGYPAPYCNHCRLYVDAQQTRIRAFDPDNNLIFQSGIQPTDERIYIDLDTPQGYRFEIRENTSSATGVNYSVVWYRGQ
jgi:hypothetical protein